MQVLSVPEYPGFSSVRIYTEKNIFEVISFDHPFRPRDSAILFVKKGKILLKEQINSIELGDSSVLLINRNYVYEVLSVDEAFEINLLVFERAFLERVALKINKLKVYDAIEKQLLRNFPFEKEELDTLWKTVDLLKYYVHNYAKIDYAEEIIENYFNVLMYHLVSLVTRHNSGQRTKMSRSQQMVYDFIMLVSEHYHDQRSLSFYTAKLGISTRYLSRVLKQETGKTATAILAEFILNEAKAQLSGSTRSISEIAHQLRFSDPYAFSHFFKRHLAMSPKQYKALFK